MSSLSRLYAPHLYDKHYRLRLPYALWALAAWALLPFAAQVAKVRLALGGWGELLADWLLMPASFPVLFVVAAYGYRTPQAGRVWRTTWHRERPILLAGLLFFSAALVGRHVDILWQPSHYLFSPLWLTLGIQALFLCYVGLARYPRDLFADYPEADDDLRLPARPLKRSPPVSPGDLFYQQALAHLQEHRSDEALIALRDAVTRDPNHAPAWEASGKLLRELGYPQEATQADEAAKAARG